MFSKIFCGNKKIFLILAVLFLNFLLVSPVLAAAPNTNYVPLVNIPGVNPNAGLLTYLSGLYSFLISVVGILAMAVIIYGGMRYLTSAGNPSSVEEAKDAITSAVTGLILALVSWLILSTINPDILVLKSVGVSGAGTYSYADTKNTCVANATGTGTAANPCVCIDGETVHAKSGVGTISTNLTLTSPASGSSAVVNTMVTLAGKLTDFTGAPLGSKQVYIQAIYTDPATGASKMQNTRRSTDASGNYSFDSDIMDQCAGTVKLQAYFEGDSTYAPTSSGFNTFTATGTPACTLANFPSNVKSSGGSACQSICSDTTLSNDGAFHCLVVGIRIGWVPNDDPADYTDAQLRAMATGVGTEDNPYQTIEGSRYVVDMGRYSTVLNTPGTYRWDGNGGNPDGRCDTNDPTFKYGDWAVLTAYIPATLPSPYICKATQTPKGITCGQKFCVWDSKNNWAETTLYFTILAKP